MIMKRTATLASLVLGSLLAAGCGPKVTRNPWEGQILPLAKGASWTYNATVVHYDQAVGKEVKTSLEWTTTVVDVLPGDGVTAYIVKGWPSDLITSTGEKPLPTERVLLKSDDGFLWGHDRAATVTHADGWFALPMQDGAQVCPDPSLPYCWAVGEKEGGYELAYRAGPEEEKYLLEPGRGVIKYDYTNSGTTDSVAVSLVKFEPGSPVPDEAKDGATP
jgi:hypothetical protein